MEQERKELNRLRFQNESLEKRIEDLTSQNKDLKDTEEQLRDKVLGLQQDRAFYA